MKIVFIIGTSGSGKSYLERHLVEKSSEFKRIKSFTTRSVREQEVGDEYHFITSEKYKEYQEKGEVVQDVSFAGNTYGSFLNEYDKDKINVIVCVPYSMNQILEYFKNDNIQYKTIVLDKKKDVIESNMLKRGQTLEDINKRLEQDDIAKQILEANIKPDILITSNEFSLDDIIKKLNS